MKNYLNSDFETAYTHLYNKYNNIFEKLRKKEILKYTIYIILSILYFSLLLFLLFKFKLHLVNSGSPFIIVLLAFTALYLYIYNIISKKLKKDNYVITYKNSLISEYIKLILPNFIYSPTVDSLASNHLANIYRKSTLYNRGFTKYYIDDCINGSLDNNTKITIFDLTTIFEHNHTKRTTETTFSGLFTIIKLNYSKDYNIKILNKQKERLLINETIKGSVELDDDIFNKNFAVDSNSELDTFRLLTSEVTSFLNEQYLKNGLEFDISIIKDTIYIRIHTRPMFEPSILKRTLNKKSFQKHYNILNFILNFSNKINEIYKDSSL